MRLTIVLLLSAWLLGTAFGVFAVDAITVAGAAVIAAVTAFAWRQRLQVIMAIGLVIVLGTLYGYAVIPAEHVCDPPGSMTGNVVVVRPRIEDMQFVAEAQDGCRFLVTAPTFPVVQLGDMVRVSGGSVQSMASVRDYSEGYADYLVRQKISGTWLHPTLIIVSEAGGERPPLARGTEYAKRQIDTVFVEPDTSIITAMLLAQRGKIPPPIVDDFRHTGISHVLAISGLHISLVATMLLVLLGVAPLKPWPRTILLMALLWVYIVAIGQPVSAVRAGWFWTIALFGLRLQLLLSLPSILLLTATGLVSWNPNLWLDVGWQLSASAVLGILLILFISQSWREKISYMPSWLVSLFLVSLGAGLATGPLVAFHFGIVAPISLLANLLVVPVIPFIIGLSFIVIAINVVWPSLALVAALPVHALVLWITFIAATFAQLPHAYVTDVVVTPRFVFIYYTLLIGVIVWLKGIKLKTWRQLWVP